MKAELIEQESVSIATPKGQEIWKAEAKRALAVEQDLKVVDNESYLVAGEQRAKWGAMADARWALLNPGCQDSDKLHKKLTKDRDECCDPFWDAAANAKQKMIAYNQEQDRIRLLEQARLEAEGRRKEEERRQEALRIAKEEAQRQAEARRAEEQARLELAATLEAAGANDAAQAIVDEALAMPAVDTSRVEEALAEIKEPIRPAPVILPPATPKIAGFSSTRRYNIEITDRKAFLAGIVSGKIPDLAWEPNETFNRQQAQAMKQAIEEWPGVRLTWKDV